MVDIELTERIFSNFIKVVAIETNQKFGNSVLMTSETETDLYFDGS
jgi:hypothetical protein